MKNPYLLLHLAVFIAGFTGVFGKLISLNEIPLVWYRVVLSAVILTVLMKALKVVKPQTKHDRLAIAKVGLFITIHWIFFYGSIKYANISIGVVCFCLTSFFTAILEPLLNKTKFKPLQLVLSTFTLLGISLIFHFDSSYQLGIGLGVISSAFAALYTIYNERLVVKYDSKVISYYQMLAGATLMTVIMPFYHYLYPQENLWPNTTDAISLFLLASVCTVGLYTLLAELLKKISAFTMNLTFNLEPIYAIIIAFIFFKEGKEVNFSFYVGLGLVITTVILQSVIGAKQRRKASLSLQNQ